MVAAAELAYTDDITPYVSLLEAFWSRVHQDLQMGWIEVGLEAFRFLHTADFATWARITRTDDPASVRDRLIRLYWPTNCALPPTPEADDTKESYQRRCRRSPLARMAWHV